MISVWRLSDGPIPAVGLIPGYFFVEIVEVVGGELFDNIKKNLY